MGSQSGIARGKFRPTKQLFGGADGVAYYGTDPEGHAVELRVLRAAQAQPERWAELQRRLQIVKTFDHPGSLAISELRLQNQPPFVVLPLLRRRLWQRLPIHTPAALDEVLRWAIQLADVCQAAHRHGLVHGQLRPEVLYVQGDHQFCLDLTGIECGQFPDLKADSVWFSPEQQRDRREVDMFSDSYTFGLLLTWMLTDTTDPRQISRVQADMKDPRWAVLETLVADTQRIEPADRPLLGQILHQLADLLESQQRPGLAQDQTSVEESDEAFSHEIETPEAPVQGAHLTSGVPTQPTPQPDMVVGRFRLLNQLGEGGMGTVFRAEDLADGSIVAIKVMRSDRLTPSSLHRFRKEARLLAKLNNPFVSRLIEFNEDQGLFYLACEFVAGESLQQVLRERKKLPEQESLTYLADICRALIDAHRQGIVHRDIKPANILLVASPKLPVPPTASANGSTTTKDKSTTSDKPATLPAPDNHNLPACRAILIDFGLARQEEQTESLAMTTEGTFLGTPLYASPEQAQGSSVDPRSDVYSLGVTLFHLLTGSPPFVGETALITMTRHITEPLPSMRKLEPGLSEAVVQIVEKATQKDPKNRYPDAEAMLVELERALRGEPNKIERHSNLPASKDTWVGRWSFTLELKASPVQLWPYVSNTERVNRAIGLPAVEFTTNVDPDFGVRRFGTTRMAGMKMQWEEHPFEWIEGRRMGVVREFSSGPFRWFSSVVDFEPLPKGGTRLTQTIQIVPNGFSGRLVAQLVGGVKAPSDLKTVYKRIDQTISQKQAEIYDPFQATRGLSRSQLQELDARLDRLTAAELPAAVIQKLRDYLIHASDQDVARIRPIAFAHRFNLDVEAVISTFLHAGQEGILNILWDILCPICKIPADIKETLAQVAGHGSCTACDLDFELDFSNSVELIFRVHPQLRSVEVRTYCVGGPAHSPHVAAQTRLQPGEHIELQLHLEAGSYRIRSPQTKQILEFRVRPNAITHRWEVPLGGSLLPIPTLLADNQVITIANQLGKPAIVRVERTAGRDDALTAARAAAHPVFRRLFPGQLLTPGQLVNIAHVTLMLIRLDQGEELFATRPESEAFQVVRETFRLAEKFVTEEGGTIVKTFGDCVVAAFPEAIAAIRTALELRQLMRRSHVDMKLSLSMAIHAGPALVTTIENRLDYFGAMVHQTHRLFLRTGPGELFLSATVAEIPEVTTRLQPYERIPILSEETGELLAIQVEWLKSESAIRALHPELVTL